MWWTITKLKKKNYDGWITFEKLKIEITQKMALIEKFITQVH
jgi:hypothetical protein